MNRKPSYDCIVVGSGIAGLYVAQQLSNKNPKWTIAICERYKGLGGRTYSYSPPGFEGVSWEMGAGRVHKSHKLLMNLIKKYKLTWIPISDEIAYQKSPGAPLEPNLFESVFIPIYLEPLSRLSPKLLATHTIYELLELFYGPHAANEILNPFPYRAEVFTLRADLALQSFLGGGEMSSHKGYGVLKEGFGELVARMRADLESRGCVVLQRHRVLNLKKGPGNTTDLEIQFGYDDPKSSGKIVLRAEKAVVLALHRDAVAELPAFQGWKTLDRLKCEPLLRTYAIFPTKNGRTWFSGLPRIVTPERPRYILPMNPEKGAIMISYTDAQDTKQYMKIQEKDGDKALESVILKDVRRLFPSLYIPKPLFFKSHPWTVGATYWLPGDYSAEKESLESAHPLPSKLPNVWLCGESWGLRQAWVEGALESAELCLKVIQ
jgi:hypothetical protein